MPLLRALFTDTKLMLWLIFLICAAALAAAFFAEAVLLLEPCILCIYQRYPFAIAAVLALLGLFFRKARFGLFILIALVLFVNSGIATYHTGVEQKWWESAVEGCKVTFDDPNSSPQTILENIMSAPTGHCDQIPWVDPVLGLSMANYNIPLCLILGVYAALGAIRTGRRGATPPKSP